MFNLLEPFLGLEQNEWILLGVVLAAVVLILIIVVLIASARKSKRTKANKANTFAVESEVATEQVGEKSVEESVGQKADEPIVEQPVEQSATPDRVQAPASKEFVEEELTEGELDAEEETVEQPTAVQNSGSDDQQKAKPLNKVYHIAKRRSDGRWQVKMAKGAKAIKLFLTQAEAIAYAKKLALSQEAKIIIHKEDGSFRKLTYKSKK